MHCLFPLQEQDKQDLHLQGGIGRAGKGGRRLSHYANIISMFLSNVQVTLLPIKVLGSRV